MRFRATRLALYSASLTIAVTTSLSAQPVLKPLLASAVVSSVARVVSISPLVSGSRLPTGDVYLSGTVVSTSNGPFALQAGLVSAIADTVMGRKPDGTLAMLTVSGWVTVATGVGGPSKTSSVSFLVKWAKASRKKPSDAEAMPIVYRVIPQD